MEYILYGLIGLAIGIFSVKYDDWRQDRKDKKQEEKDKIKAYKELIFILQVYIKYEYLSVLDTENLDQEDKKELSKCKEALSNCDHFIRTFYLSHDHIKHVTFDEMYKDAYYGPEWRLEKLKTE